MVLREFQTDRLAAAEYISAFLPELLQLSRASQHKMLSYLLNLAQLEALDICAASETQAPSSGEIRATR